MKIMNLEMRLGKQIMNSEEEIQMANKALRRGSTLQIFKEKNTSENNKLITLLIKVAMIKCQDIFMKI